MTKRKSYKYITIGDRHNIEKWYFDGVPTDRIADRVNVTRTTIYRELKRGFTGGLYEDKRPEYSADLAQSKVMANFGKRGDTKSTYRAGALVKNIQGGAE